MNPSQDPKNSAPDVSMSMNDPAPATNTISAATVANSAAMNPGKTLGIVGMVLSIVGIGLVGLILSIVAMNKSKAVGMKNGFALAGLIIGIVNIVFGLIFGILFIAGLSKIASTCSDLGSGSHYVDGVTYNCGS
ncbi:MAG: DUF4190 domain-containing protein [Candidatus Saccharimonadales bacterium]